MDVTLPAAAPARLSVRCANCAAVLPLLTGTAVEGPAAFCPACGQATGTRPPDPKAAVRKALSSFALLLFRPGFLSREWIAGRRVRYLHPRVMYVAVMVGFIVALRLVPLPAWAEPDEVTAGTSALAADLAVPVQALRSASWGVADGARGGALVLLERLQARTRAEGDAAFFRRALAETIALLYYAGLVLLPVYALCLWLSYRASGLRFTDHLVFAAHASTGWALMLCAAYLSPWVWVAVGVLALAVLRGWFESRTVYGALHRSAGRRLLLNALTLLYMLPFQVFVLWYLTRP